VAVCHSWGCWKSSTVFCLCKCHFTHKHKIVVDAISIENFPSFQDAITMTATIISCFMSVLMLLYTQTSNCWDAIFKLPRLLIATIIYFFACVNVTCHTAIKLLVMQFQKKIFHLFKMPLPWLQQLSSVFVCFNASLHTDIKLLGCDFQIAMAVDRNNHLPFCLCKCHLSHSHQIVGDAISKENFPSFQNAIAKNVKNLFCLCKCYFIHKHQIVGDAISNYHYFG
jgi:hypothetical protein